MFRLHCAVTMRVAARATRLPRLVPALQAMVVIPLAMATTKNLAPVCLNSLSAWSCKYHDYVHVKRVNETTNISITKVDDGVVLLVKSF